MGAWFANWVEAERGRFHLLLPVGMGAAILVYFALPFEPPLWLAFLLPAASLAALIAAWCYTTLTIAFARALAASGLRVLAIDGDIRCPSFDPVFCAAGVAGLTDHLTGLASLDDILRPDTLSPLTIIAAGTQAQAALTLFLSTALRDCLAALRPRFDVILLDVPPAFALAEGRVLAQLADAALLCVRWGNTPRCVVLAAMTLLREAGVTLAGAALTHVNVKAHGRSGFADANVSRGSPSFIDATASYHSAGTDHIRVGERQICSVPSPQQRRTHSCT